MKKIANAFILVTCLSIVMLTGCNTPSTVQQNSVSSTKEESQKSAIESYQESVSESSQESKTESKNSSPPMDGDFRYAKWGMSMDEVRQGETIELFEQDNFLACLDEKVLGFPVQILFVFDNDTLHSGMYHFKQKHSEDLLYYEDYQKIVISYMGKYGDPTEQIDNWKNTLYKYDPSKWGRAVAAEHVNFVSKWVTDTSTIGIALSGDNFKVSLSAIYEALEYEQKTNTDGI